MGNIQTINVNAVEKAQDTANKTDLPKYWERDYIVSRINAVQNPQHRMLLKFMWMSGVRVTEAVSLQKKDIDFANFTMRVKWLKSRRYNYRVVPLHPTLKDILEVYTGGMLASDRVFPITRQRAWQIFQQHMNGHPHQMRHSFAVNWIRCGGDVVILHKVLGHSKIQTTMQYLNIVPVDQGKELMKVSFT